MAGVQHCIYFLSLAKFYVNDRKIHAKEVGINIYVLLLLNRFSRGRLFEIPQTAAHQTPLSIGFSRQDSVVQEVQEMWFDPWVGKIPLRRAWQPTPVFLPGEPHEQKRLADYSPGGHKESDTTEVT